MSQLLLPVFADKRQWVSEQIKNIEKHQEERKFVNEIVKEIIRAHTNKEDSVIRSTIKIVYLSKITGNVCHKACRPFSWFPKEEPIAKKEGYSGPTKKLRDT